MCTMSVISCLARMFLTNNINALIVILLMFIV